MIRNRNCRRELGFVVDVYFVYFGGGGGFWLLGWGWRGGKGIINSVHFAGNAEFRWFANGRDGCRGLDVLVRMNVIYYLAIKNGNK